MLQESCQPTIQISWHQAALLLHCIFDDNEAAIRQCLDTDQAKQGRPLTKEERWALDWVVTVHEEDCEWFPDSDWHNLLNHLNSAFDDSLF